MLLWFTGNFFLNFINNSAVGAISLYWIIMYYLKNWSQRPFLNSKRVKIKQIFGEKITFCKIAKCKLSKVCLMLQKMLYTKTNTKKCLQKNERSVVPVLSLYYFSLHSFLSYSFSSFSLHSLSYSFSRLPYHHTPSCHTFSHQTPIPHTSYHCSSSCCTGTPSSCTHLRIVCLLVMRILVVPFWLYTFLPYFSCRTSSRHTLNIVRLLVILNNLEQIKVQEKFLDELFCDIYGIKFIHTGNQLRSENKAFELP